ncbi:uncharacterized protein LOC126891296 [Diabrotica virgifera virgifera]|uniref:C2H2-type domain-containing protein n=1 Tax=Diabrotica virgifera virgifera TaxID=50390 RepID=A0ABM5L1W6_DIAVI|nr:uncharacterized protein LOC126891296 [Diabrotica virgifera virgifera]
MESGITANSSSSVEDLDESPKTERRTYSSLTSYFPTLSVQIENACINENPRGGVQDKNIWEQTSDDSDNDPNYCPEEEDNANSLEMYSSQNVSQNTNNQSLKSINTSKKSYDLNITGLNPCDDNEMYVDSSKGRSGANKANFCIYCHTKQKKIARHFALKHKQEESVKTFLDLPKNSKERRKCIEVLRNRGNFLFNTDKNYNDGELIVCRRPTRNHRREANYYKPCSNCKAYFAKNTLRDHYKKCTKVSSKTSRIVMIESKRVIGRIHAKASKRVRNELFPPLREDGVVRIIRYDELVIIYANKMEEKYKNSRHFEMIRQRIRLVGRFLTRMRSINQDITDLTSVYDPKYIDDTRIAINAEAGLDEKTDIYKTPTVAFNLGTLLKQIGQMLINESIKKHDNETQSNADNFLQLLNQEVAIGINRTVAKSQFLEQRRKKLELPSIEDIKKLHYYLANERRKAFYSLKTKFSIDFWTKLCETTLTSIQVFNRRRAGEIERILIKDFEAHESVDENTNKDIFNSLSTEKQTLAKKYVRFQIRGKLNRNVPVLLDQQLAALN